MAFLVTLIAVTVVSALLRKPIKAAPWVFYILAVLADIALISTTNIVLPRGLRIVMAYLMQRGGLGVAMFVLVMYIGVFPRNGKISHWFRPIRAELSIIACILIAGHMTLFLPSYLPRLFGGAIVKGHVGGAIVVAICLLVLVVVLGITSFRFVKKHMKARSWKKLQQFAYLFYVLIFVHLILMLGPAAISGNTRTAITAIVYFIVFAAYVALRIWRAKEDKREKIDLAETVLDQGFVE